MAVGKLSNTYERVEISHTEIATYVSFELWLMLTWSLGCTGFLEPSSPPRISMARLEMT